MLLSLSTPARLRLDPCENVRQAVSDQNPNFVETGACSCRSKPAY
jgi:hypothetical protein